jgi:hypothetical protein
MNSWRGTCESQKQILNQVLKDNHPIAGPDISLMTDCVKENILPSNVQTCLQ